MPINLATEHIISFAEAAKLLPKGRGEKPTHTSCVFRWVADGVKGPGGHRVRLEGIRLGGRWLTSREALQRFADALTPAAAADGDDYTHVRSQLHKQTTQTIPRSPTKRRRAVEAATRELERAGV